MDFKAEQKRPPFEMYRVPFRVLRQCPKSKPSNKFFCRNAVYSLKRGKKNEFASNSFFNVSNRIGNEENNKTNFWAVIMLCLPQLAGTHTHKKLHWSCSQFSGLEAQVCWLRAFSTESIWITTDKFSLSCFLDFLSAQQNIFITEKIWLLECIFVSFGMIT